MAGLNRTYKGDRYSRMTGCPIPVGSTVRVVKFLARRRAVVEYQGKRYYTLLFCLAKISD